MRAPTFWLALPLALLSAGALAQSSAPPQQLERIEEADDAVTVTSKPAQGTKIVEKRDNSGRVVEARVNSGGSSYTLKPNTPAGSALPGDAAGQGQRGPMWTIMEFDILSKKKQRSADEADKDDVPPPPPAAPAKR